MGSCMSRQQPNMDSSPIIEDVPNQSPIISRPLYSMTSIANSVKSTIHGKTITGGGSRLQVEKSGSSISSKQSSRMDRMDEVSSKQFDLKEVTLKTSVGEDDDFMDNEELEKKKKIQLYEYIYNRKWQNALEMLENYESYQIADYIDRNQRTCLHWACLRNAPPPLVHTLITAFPPAASHRDNMGRVPLHIACEYGSDSLVSLVLGFSSSSTKCLTMKDFQNERTPLAEAVMNHRSAYVMESIVRMEPSQIMVLDKKGNTPIVAFFKMHLAGILQYMGNSTQTLQVYNVEELIRIVGILLKAEHQILDSTGIEQGEKINVDGENSEEGDDEDEGEEAQHKISNILIDAIKSPTCQSVFVEFILRFYPEVADIKDNNGNLPIHIAASMKPELADMVAHAYKCDACGSSQRPNEFQYYRRNPKIMHRQVLSKDCIEDSEMHHYEELFPVNKVHGIIMTLLDIKRDYASSCNQDGVLPLVLAIKAGHRWPDESLQQLLRSYPEAVEIEDKSTGFYPFMVAALCDGQKETVASTFYDEEADLQIFSTIFEFLRRYPLEKKVNHGGNIRGKEIKIAENYQETNSRCDETLNTTFMSNDEEISVIQVLADVAESDEDDSHDCEGGNYERNEENDEDDNTSLKTKESENHEFVPLSPLSDSHSNDDTVPRAVVSDESTNDSKPSNCEPLDDYEEKSALNSNVNKLDTIQERAVSDASDEDTEGELGDRSQSTIQERTESDAPEEDTKVSKQDPITEKVTSSMRQMLTSSQGVSSMIELGLAAIS